MEQGKRHYKDIQNDVKNKLDRIFEICGEDTTKIWFSVDNSHMSYDQRDRYGVLYSDNIMSVFVRSASRAVIDRSRTWGYVKAWLDESTKWVLDVLAVHEENDVDTESAKELMILCAQIYYMIDAERGFMTEISKIDRNGLSYYFKIPEIKYTNEYLELIGFYDDVK